MSVTHDPINDLWTFTYSPSPPESATAHVEAMTYEGDFTLMGQVSILPVVGGLGLFFRKDGIDQFDFTLRSTLMEDPESLQVVGPAPPQWLKIEYYEGAAHLAYGYDDFWTNLDPITVERPDEVGMVMTVDVDSPAVHGLIAEYRLLPDRYTMSTTQLGVAPLMAGITPMGAPVATSEAIVHGLVGAQFGDLEFDVGKSVRWSQWFVDDLYITDINTGTQRYWVVNWALTVPEAFHGVSEVNYFVDPVTFRKEQFLQASRSLIMDETDWVLFVDAHEGMSVDSRSLPDDYLIEPFRSFIYREIARAEVLLGIVLSYRSLPSSGTASSRTSLGRSPDVAPVVQPMGVPYYIPQQGLPRLIKVSALRNPAFNWTTLDQPTAIVDPAVKIQLVSYGYAHWNLQDIVPPATEVEPLTEANDDGWRMRNLLSRIRPVATLPYGSPWKHPNADPAGEVGPWAVNFPGMAPENVMVPVPPPAPTVATAPILAPLYHTVFRLNLRDGVWYDEGQSGNVPLAWDAENGKWVAAEDPEVWASS